MIVGCLLLLIFQFHLERGASCFMLTGSSVETPEAPGAKIHTPVLQSLLTALPAFHKQLHRSHPSGMAL